MLSEDVQLVVPVAVLQPPPSMLTSTFATATLSAAEPDTVVVPAIVAPLVGALMKAVGGVKSMTMLVEVTKYVSNGAKSVLPSAESVAFVARRTKLVVKL